MIDQIPHIISVASPTPTRRTSTPLATISAHHIAPEFFFGYEMDPITLVKMATPEKALVDIFYLKPAKSLWFKKLPEVEIPPAFNRPLSKLRFCQIPGSFEPSFRFFLQGLYQTLDITPAKKIKNWSK